MAVMGSRWCLTARTVRDLSVAPTAVECPGVPDVSGREGMSSGSQGSSGTCGRGRCRHDARPEQGPRVVSGGWGHRLRAGAFSRGGACLGVAWLEAACACCRAAGAGSILTSFGWGVLGAAEPRSEAAGSSPSSPILRLAHRSFREEAEPLVTVTGCFITYNTHSL
ncbi:hypothetical protein NDU88_004431 [Pleurodeles waltl]|uniref:Uncharacterized protein n=1 Tax=Pleurodeles waltl TaxID=8319 RepID=A0AAV7W889_PLEWA|nr:hypothetical protein NDU88_004431 [Pleurodeles waltl]